MLNKNTNIAEEIRETEQDQEEGPETKTFESSSRVQRVRNSKGNENEQETVNSKSMIETDTGN